MLKVPLVSSELGGSQLRECKLIARFFFIRGGILPDFLKKQVHCLGDHSYLWSVV